MRRSNILRMLFLLLLALTLIACGSTEDSLETSSTQEALSEMDEITIEFIIEHTDLTEADFEGVDFAAFVEMFDLVPSDVNEYHIPDLLDMYKREMAQKPVTDYSYIFDQASGTLAEGDLDQLEVLVWEYHEGIRNRYMVIDLSRNQVFFSMSDIISECSEDDKLADVTEENAAFVRSALQQSGIVGWKNAYIGTSEGTTGHLSWAIGIRLADGRCFSYRGEGVMGSGTPAELRTLLNQLTETFKK